jgi:hypothetical protein
MSVGSIQLPIVCEFRALDECLHRRLAVAVFPGVRALGIVALHPDINVRLDLARRGTLQHEVLEGDAVVAFVDGDRLEFKVNCAADAGKFSSKVPFALCVTLEVATGVAIPIYDEVRTRILPPIPIQPNPL